MFNSFLVQQTNAASWITHNGMNAAHNFHTATLLPNGKVLIAGGGGDSAETFDPASGIWTATGPMTIAREFHTATLLPNGVVLLVGGSSGGYNAVASAEHFDAVGGTWTSTSAMTNIQGRAAHTATLLPNGKVLVLGGFDNTRKSVSSAELYDPVSKTWAATMPMPISRYGATATLLPDGRVLVAGGVSWPNYPSGSATTLSSAHVYDPSNGTWTTTGFMTIGRNAHTATLLTNGTVLVVGGDSGNGYLSSAEIYDSSSGTWKATNSLTTARDSHAATLLPNGAVLVTGGDSFGVTTSSAELYDPGSGSWIAAGAMSVRRNTHTATLLPGGRVLFAGGWNTSSGALSSAELYDPLIGTWTESNQMKTYRWYHTATLLPNGRMLVVGGGGGAEVLDPTSGTWTMTAEMVTNRNADHTATLLPSGKVLVAGGFNSGYLASAEIYDPATGFWTATGTMSTERKGATATLLFNGKVLVAGGYNNVSGYLSSAELYNPVTALWEPANSMTTTRERNTATLLLSGKVLVTGGGSAEIYDPTTGAWHETGPMTTAHGFWHRATLLGNGTVLVTGGYNGGSGLSNSEIYDPDGETWLPTSSMNVSRYNHTATLLHNGSVLVTGGNGTNFLSSVEIYDPATQRWTMVGEMTRARAAHTATLLPNNKVQIAGGANSAILVYTEMYDLGLGLGTFLQPQIATVESPPGLRGGLKLTGSQFRGSSGGSSGNYQDSPTDYPLVQLRSLESGQSLFLLSAPATTWSSTNFTSAPVRGFPPGYAFVTVFANGIPSSAATTLIVSYTNRANVSLTGPAVGSRFAVPRTVNISVRAGSPYGFVARTRFYVAGAQIGTNVILVSFTNSLAGTNTYQFAWSNVPVGDYTLWSTATDDLGEEVASAPVNFSVVPVIFVNGQYSPSNNFTLPDPSSVQIALTNPYPGGFVQYTIDGSDPSGGEFYSGPFFVTNSVVIRALTTDEFFTPLTETLPVIINILPAYDLTNSTLGGGFITVSSPSGPYLSNAVVTLTATPSNNWSFLGWMGDVVTNANPLSLAMNTNKTVSAVFGTTLNMLPSSLGTIAISPTQSLYAYGSTARLTAVPNPSNYFRFWGGAAASGTSNSPLNFVVTAGNPTISAVYAAIPANQFTLNVQIGGGEGTVTRTPFATLYANGANVTLTASPAAGQAFSGWSGDAVSSQNPLQVTMDRSKTITANFNSNTPPLVEITAPHSGDTFLRGTNLLVEATASDADGSIVAIEFYAGTNRLGIVTNTPYELVWSNVAVGNYQLTAVAHDDLGGVTTSTGVNITAYPGTNPPLVSISQPANGATFTAPATINISAMATDTDGTVSRVEFYSGTNLLGVITNGTFDFAWNGVFGGSYMLKAIAVDNEGYRGTSAPPVSITVATAPPLVSITEPTNGSSFILPTNMIIRANAADADGMVTLVEFFANTNLIGSTTNLPPAVLWSNPAEGIYALTARATDNQGASTVSQPVNISIGFPTNPPVFQLSSATYQASEGAGEVVVTVLKNVSAPAGVNYATADSTARAGQDYQAKSGFLDFAVGETLKTIPIKLMSDSLFEGNETFSIRLLSPGGGGSLAGPSTAVITIVDDEVFTTNSFTDPHFPSSAPQHDGSLRVDIAPAVARGQWRLAGELSWRDGGAVLGGLPTGNYDVEFKAVTSYLQPAKAQVPVEAGQLMVLPVVYNSTLSPQFGSLLVRVKPDAVATNLDPQAQGQWRLQGGSNWLNSGLVLSNLNAGPYIVEFRPGVLGRTTPQNIGVTVVPNQRAVGFGTYLVEQTLPATTPQVLQFQAVQQSTAFNQPYGYNGQIRTPLGYGSGVVVKEKVVLTAAHVLFDEGTLSYVTNVQWLFQRDAEPNGEYEPLPQSPRGFYLLEGYATQRQLENTPGDSSLDSYKLDIGVMYFSEPAGRGGYGGYLVSDTAKQWLVEPVPKMLVGYPMDAAQGDNRGRMYATAPVLVNFDSVIGYPELFRTTALRSYGGNSGGPLYVEYTDKKLYPAGVYLGGSAQTVVRAIDGTVAELIRRAEISSNGGTNSTGGGVIFLGAAIPNSGLLIGYLKVNITPPEAVSAGAAWWAVGFAGIFSPTNTVGAIATTYPIAFASAPGFLTPAPRDAEITSGQTQEIDVEYVRFRLGVDLTYGLGVPDVSGVAYQIQFAPSLQPPIMWSNFTVLSNGGIIPPRSLLTNGPHGFYRARILP